MKTTRNLEYGITRCRPLRDDSTPRRRKPARGRALFSLALLLLAPVVQGSSMTVGQPYGGGLIGYILTSADAGYTPSAMKGIIVAKADTNTRGVVWTTAVVANTPAWEGKVYPCIGASATGLLAGTANTAKIIAAVPSGSYAALAATQYRGGGFTDWVLPSKNDLDKIYSNQKLLGAFPQGWYWSSTEWPVDNCPGTDNENLAYARNFADGNSTQQAASNSEVRGYKGFPYGVRPVRYFQVPQSAGSFSPTTVTGGQTLTIAGSGFNPAETAYTITFAGGGSATATVLNNEQLSVVVPPNALTGPITLSVGGAVITAFPGSLTVAPTVASLSTLQVLTGQTIVITGSNFNPDSTHDMVTFGGGVNGTISQATSTSLTVVVPANAVSGTVTVTVGGIKSQPSVQSLIIIKTPAFVRDFVPTSPQVSSFGLAFGLAIDGGNNIYIGDTAHADVLMLSSDGKFMQYFLPPGTTSLSQQPTGIRLDTAGNVYIGSSNSIVKYDYQGKYISSIDVSQGGGSLLAFALDAAGDVYVTKNQGNTLFKYSATGKLLITWNYGDPDNSQFLDVEVDAHNNIYLSDGYGGPGVDPQVYKLNSEGKIIGTITRKISGVNNDFPLSPSRITLRPDGLIIVGYKECACLAMFDQDLNYILQWPNNGYSPDGYAIAGPGAVNTNYMFFEINRAKNKVDIYNLEPSPQQAH